MIENKKVSVDKRSLYLEKMFYIILKAKTTKKITIKLMCEKCETYSIKNIGVLY